MNEPRYALRGYSLQVDKFETLCESSSLEHLENVARAVINYHTWCKPLCYEGTKKPFTQFDIGETGKDGTGDTIRLYTKDCPDGEDPRQRKRVRRDKTNEKDMP